MKFIINFALWAGLLYGWLCFGSMLGLVERF
jgi:hypothetical protein